MTSALTTVRVCRPPSMAASGAVFVEGLAALAASTTAAENAAGITETGGTPAIGAAWTGGGSDPKLSIRTMLVTSHMAGRVVIRLRILGLTGDFRITNDRARRSYPTSPGPCLPTAGRVRPLALLCGASPMLPLHGASPTVLPLPCVYHSSSCATSIYNSYRSRRVLGGACPRFPGRSIQHRYEYDARLELYCQFWRPARRAHCLKHGLHDQGVL